MSVCRGVWRQVVQLPHDWTSGLRVCATVLKLAILLIAHACCMSQAVWRGCPAGQAVLLTFLVRLDCLCRCAVCPPNHRVGSLMTATEKSSYHQPILLHTAVCYGWKTNDDIPSMQRHATMANTQCRCRYFEKTCTACGTKGLYPEHSCIDHLRAYQDPSTGEVLYDKAESVSQFCLQAYELMKT